MRRPKLWSHLRVAVTPKEGCDLEELAARVKAALESVEGVAHFAMHRESKMSHEDKIVAYLEKVGEPKRGVEIVRGALGYQSGGNHFYRKLQELWKAGRIYSDDGGKTYESRIPDDD